MAEKAEQPVITEPTKDELNVAYHGPATLSNRIFVTTTSGGVRIAFTEQHGEKLPEFRTAAFMPFESAIALKNVLTTMLADVEKKIEAQKEAAVK